MRPFRLLFLLLLSAAASAVPAKDAPCFGAAGNGCATIGERAQPGYCKAQPGGREVECVVNAGSIEHDSCCATHPNGRGCAGKGDDGSCAYEWDKSQSRTAHGLYWTRRFDPLKPNRNGVPDFNQLCAPAGSVIAAGDERWCCSRSASALAERDLQGINKLRCR